MPVAINTIADVMVPAIGSVVVATGTITAAIGIYSRGGWVCTVRLITVHTTTVLGDHGIQAAVVTTGHDAAVRTGAGAKTIWVV